MNAEAQQNPYAPPEAEVSDFVSDQPLEHASRAIRFGAAVLDGVIWIVTSIPMMVSAFGSGGLLVDPMTLFSGTGFVITAVAWLALAAITIVFVHRNGQTVGKKLVGIKVVRSDGSRASLGRIFWLRNVVNSLPQIIPLLNFLYPLIDHLFIFGDKRQCLHDKIADTIVVTA